MKDKTIVLLACQNDFTNIVYNSLKNNFKIERVIIEKRIPKILFLKKRIKKFGFLKVFGQVTFRLIVRPYLNIISHKRIQELIRIYQLDNTPIDKSKIINVPSANSEETIAILKEINPWVVVINGTRIISEKVLNSVPAKFINLHAGIAPLYRGVHCAYWALVENNRKACGVTIHLLDTGIDTGNILEQEIINPTKEDTAATYGLLQFAAGIPLLKKSIKDIFEDRIKIRPYPEGRSRLWSHPTLPGYIWHRIRHGIK